MMVSFYYSVVKVRPRQESMLAQLRPFVKARSGLFVPAALKSNDKLFFRLGQGIARGVSVKS